MSAISTTNNHLHTTVDVSSQKRPKIALFLDVDGVLNSKDEPTESYAKMQKIAEQNLPKDELEKEMVKCQFNSEAVENLMCIIRTISTDAEVGIVVSSTWRIGKSIDQLKNETFYKLPFAPSIIDKIPDFVIIEESKSNNGKSKKIDSKPRLIEYWINNNLSKLAIDAFAVLDDYDGTDLRDPQGKMSLLFKDKFVKINGKQRLTKADSEYAIKILKSQLTLV
jgi:hypothetical protein